MKKFFLIGFLFVNWYNETTCNRDRRYECTKHQDHYDEQINQYDKIKIKTEYFTYCVGNDFEKRLSIKDIILLSKKLLDSIFLEIKLSIKDILPGKKPLHSIFLEIQFRKQSTDNDIFQIIKEDHTEKCNINKCHETCSAKSRKLLIAYLNGNFHQNKSLIDNDPNSLKNNEFDDTEE